MMENSESNHTIATDLLLTPSTSSQHGLTIPGESRDPHQPLTHGGAEGATIEEADEGPEDSQTRTHDSTSSPPLTSVPPSPTVSLRPESAHQSILSNFRRVVAQDEKEPLCVILFKWTLIVVGAIMLGCVMFVMGEVIHAWATEPRSHQLTVMSSSHPHSRSSGHGHASQVVMDFVDRIYDQTPGFQDVFDEDTFYTFAACFTLATGLVAWMASRYLTIKAKA
eukprot:snap_masked-scaffold645_size120276-processed-gene-0.9 protein:Tk11122 transcript:snap_masked-scaffold645_size120276-processed-gene-0.9-mRNA-1 annotation:"mitochondrial 50s ribosomal protein l53"